MEFNIEIFGENFSGYLFMTPDCIDEAWDHHPLLEGIHCQNDVSIALL